MDAGGQSTGGIGTIMWGIPAIIRYRSCGEAELPFVKRCTWMKTTKPSLPLTGLTQ
jgi:hypothetical protein